MRSRTYTTQGIILKRANIGEADRLLSIFTKEHGKLRVIAKGVRRPTSRKAANVELFKRSKLFLARGRNLDLVTQVETIEDFPGIRKSLPATKAAYHAVELVEFLTAENQENRRVYEALVRLLRLINAQGQATRRQITRFEKEILGELGFGSPKGSSHATLKSFIEEIIDRRLRTEEIFKEV